MLAAHEIAVKDFRPYIEKFQFDPTNGFSLKNLLELQLPEAAPDDFSDFWQNAHNRNDGIDSAIELRPSHFPSPTHTIREIYFDSLGDFRIGGWICEPLDRTAIKRIEVIGHGYGGREQPDLASLDPSAIQVFICSPGFHLSACPDRVATNAAMLHVITGIHSLETYILLPCAAAIWSASRAMAELQPDLPQVYRGGSFGGGMGALLLPWESRFRAAEIVQPTFGNHTLRLANRCTGSGESVRQLLQLHPPIRKTLTYFDAAIAARQIKVPVAVAACAFDPSVCPPGQFSVANAIPEHLRKLSPFSFGHCEFPHKHLELEQARHQTTFAQILAEI